MAQHNEKILVANDRSIVAIRATYAGQIHHFLACDSGCFLVCFPACFERRKMSLFAPTFDPNFEPFNWHRSPNIEACQQVGFKKFQLGCPGWFVDLNNQSSGIKFERFDMTTHRFTDNFGPSRKDGHGGLAISAPQRLQESLNTARNRGWFRIDRRQWRLLQFATPDLGERHQEERLRW